MAGMGNIHGRFVKLSQRPATKHKPNTALFKSRNAVLFVSLRWDPMSLCTYFFSAIVGLCWIFLNVSRICMQDFPNFVGRMVHGAMLRDYSEEQLWQATWQQRPFVWQIQCCHAVLKPLVLGWIVAIQCFTHFYTTLMSFTNRSSEAHVRGGVWPSSKSVAASKAREQPGLLSEPAHASTVAVRCQVSKTSSYRICLNT